MKPTATAAMLALLAACASAPKLSYYTLDMSSSGAVSPTVDIEVDRLRVAEKIDRHRIVIHRSPTRVEFYRTGRWAASVGEMVQRKLAAEFGPPAAGRRALVIDGKVTAFEQVDSPAGPRARVRMEVTIRDAASRRFDPPLLEKAYESVRPADDDSIDGVVRALTRAVEDIAAEIADDAGRSMPE